MTDQNEPGPGGETERSQAKQDADRQAARIRAGRSLMLGPVEFVKGVVALKGLPEPDRPEVAFAGRSNVGKSSLINALTRRNGLARASSEPGRTQELNYFTLGETGYLVDLPGYGFAKAPKKAVDRWTALTRDYLRGRVSLARVFLLIDSRHGLKDLDRGVMETLDKAAVSYQIILTKSDKIKAPERETVLAQTAGAIAKRPAAFPETLITSIKDDEALDKARGAVAQAMEGWMR